MTEYFLMLVFKYSPSFCGKIAKSIVNRNISCSFRDVFLGPASKAI